MSLRVDGVLVKQGTQRRVLFKGIPLRKRINNESTSLITLCESYTRFFIYSFIYFFAAASSTHTDSILYVTRARS